MAVVFISPKHKQKMFILGITASLAIFLVVISLWTFLAQPKPGPTQAVFNKPKVSLNIDILNDEQFKTIEPFERIPLQFSYEAIDKKGKTTKGLISAVSEEEATKIIEQGKILSVRKIEEVGVGRENPFIPYDVTSVIKNNTKNITTK